ncbi:hypothetical protein Hypma_003764 [Hypsizygus marmoreus]|uniref:DUF6533 domain-containing protein n=1 Tax=Hypsizygus marmoreus TaxID=39966 RepID=A0A369JA48_HYPMA|nr:hypothetical protein Hypma_003764 [Hypsizygus marmoreus]
MDLGLSKRANGRPSSPSVYITAAGGEPSLIHNYLHLLAISILLYDHLMTFGNEVHYFWRRPKTRSAYWFFFNRYLAFFGNTVEVILFFTTLSAQRFAFLSPTPSTSLSFRYCSCKQYSLFRQLMLISNQALVCVLLTLRIYALYGCSRRILAFMVGSWAIMTGISCWALFGQKIVHAGQETGCHVGLSSDTAIRLAGPWEALFVFDSIIFILTMVKTWRGRHEFSFNRASIPIIYLIFRDGAIYFAVMALANLANIMTFYSCGPFMRGGLSTFGSSISVTMMSRLMLNLHEAANAGIYSTTLSAFPSRNMEYHMPTGSVELNTLGSGNRSNPSTFQGQSFRVDESYHFHVSRGI